MQVLLDQVAQKKIGWDKFKKRVENPLNLSRLASKKELKTLLHLAVLEEQFDLIEQLKDEPFLKSRRDQFGLSPMDFAKLMNNKRAIAQLSPVQEGEPFSDFPPLPGFEYLNSPVFETKEQMQEVIGIVAKAKNHDLIPSEKIWMGIYFDKEVRKGVHPPISVRWIDSDVGYGVFANQKITPCTFVGEYTGEVFQKSAKELLEKRYCVRYTVWGGKKNFCIDAEKKGNFSRWINHSASPNLGLQSIYWRGIPRMVLISLKEIPEGSQLTFDYGTYFWKHHPKPPKKFEQ